MAVRVRPSVYRDKEGFSITGSPPGEKGFPISIFVRCRSTAVRIRRLYNAQPKTFPSHEAWKAAKDQLHERTDMLIRADARVKVCRR
jgi:hypothetical protein